jgi:ketosteroid isomerase-like protein
VAVATEDGILIERERARADALVRGDKTATADMLAPDFSYTHSTGKVDDRDSYLAAFGTNYRFVSVAQSNLSVRRRGEVGIVAGDLDVVLVPKGGEQRLSRLRFISVWTQHQGNWQLIAFQNTTRAPSV